MSEPYVSSLLPLPLPPYIPPTLPPSLSPSPPPPLPPSLSPSISPSLSPSLPPSYIYLTGSKTNNISVVYTEFANLKKTQSMDVGQVGFYNQGKVRTHMCVCTTGYFTASYTALHCTLLHCTVLHCTVLYCTALHCTVYCTALHTIPKNEKTFFK